MLLPLEYGFVPPWGSTAPSQSSSFPPVIPTISGPTTGAEDSDDGKYVIRMALFNPTSPYPFNGYPLLPESWGMKQVNFVAAAHTSGSGAYELTWDTRFRTLRVQKFGVEIPVGNQPTGVTFSLMIIGSR